MYLLIAAAGSGQRLGLQKNKVFAELRGHSLLERSLRLALDAGLRPVIIHAPRERAAMEAHLAAYASEDLHFVPGGATRQESVRLGLRAIVEMEGGPTDVLVGVHDCARCLASPELLKRVFAAASEAGSALPVVPVTDTIKSLGRDGRISTPDRSRLRAAQTPQVARLSLLYDAHQQAWARGLTCSDDAQVLEAFGIQPALVEGERQNIKITHPEDFALAEYFLDHEAEA